MTTTSTTTMPINTTTTTTHEPIAKPTRIGVVTCSTRKPRLNPFLTSYVVEVLAQRQQQVNPSSPSRTTCVEFEIIDIEAQGLPFYDEPAIPALLPKDDPTPHYAHQHTRDWSAKVRAFDGFIFVTPQYNWSIPASLKNALDFLYHEWSGKPALVVSYGGKGGSKAAEHLQQILASMHMRVAKQVAMFTITTTSVDYCTERGELDAQEVSKWRADGRQDALVSAFEAMLQGQELVGRR